IVIAHDNATGDKTRGSTAIDAGVDTEYAVTKRKSHVDYGVFVRKARAIAPAEFRYTITTDEVEKIGTVKTVAFKEFITDTPAEEAAEQVGPREELYAFISREPRQLSDLELWAAQNKVSSSSLQRWLKDARVTGYLTTTYKQVGRARVAVYSVGAMPKEST